MTEKIDPARNPDLKPELDDMENQGAADAEEVVEAEEQDALNAELDE